MKVKIAYTVDMDDVPMKSAELLESAKESLEKSLEMVSTAFERIGLNKDSLGALESIDEARQKMFDADALLDDVSHIVFSYGQTVLAQKTPVIPNEPEAPSQEFFDKMLDEASDGS
tara:strand:- start:603 stop:950 length:348 start_codon:yes stop_codon:yes gene_type:complete